MPFGTYQGDPYKAQENAVRLIQSTGIDSVKCEGGSEIREALELIIRAGIPVCGHLGLTPQSINKFGTYAVRAKEEAEAQKLRDDAQALAEAGCFAIVLEKIPAALAAEVTQSVQIPVIGIGAGGGCDGQVLVIHDLLGINKGFSPKFLRRYANLYDVMTDAIGNYVADVKSKDFPNANEQY
jgi:3-methyl-2-oxobutanoate hydroxymethyltransferase